jgi:cell division protein FtsB
MVVLLVVLSTSATRIYKSYTTALAELNDVQQVYDHLDANCREVKQQIISLKDNPVEVERIAREKLGWCRTEEDVYHFNQSM